MRSADPDDVRAVDPVSDLLELVRFSTAFYYCLDARAPWAFAVPDLHSAKFHVVRRGRCWLHLGDEVRQLSAGDVVLLAAGVEHRLSQPLRALHNIDIERAAKQRVAPHTFRLGIGESGEAAEIVCGRLHYRPEIWGVLTSGLPDVVKVRPGDRSKRFGQLVETTTSELEQGGPGSPAVLARLGDLLVVEILRSCIAQGSADLGPGVLAALRHPATSPALAAIQRDPARSWTLDELAASALVSRSTLIAAFRDTLNCSPGEFIRRLRIAKAAQRLNDTRLPIEEIAHQVGYRSVSAFSKTFKDTVGESPGRYRERRTTSVSSAAERG